MNNLRSWQVGPLYNPVGQLHTPGDTQFPPFSHADWHIAIDNNIEKVRGAFLWQ